MEMIVSRRQATIQVNFLDFGNEAARQLTFIIFVIMNFNGIGLADRSSSRSKPTPTKPWGAWT